jgi:DNA-binding transcriptional ArsR family regulator
MQSVFEVLAERNRRTILQSLLKSERSVGELERELGRSQPSISKHLRVLREAGLVESRVEAQKRIYRLRPQPLEELDEWLEPVRRLWTEHLDALERHLDRMRDEPKKTRGSKR